jgi:cobalt/nickel transport system permease protein
MGVIGGFVGFYSYQALHGITKNMHISSFGAAWLACLIPALAASVELWLAGTFPLVPGMISMGLYHALIGVIEGGITAAVLALIAASRPDILDRSVGVPVAGVPA